MFLSQMFDERIWWIIAKNVLMVPSLCLGTRVPMDWATAATSLVHVVTTLSALWHKDKHQLKRSNCHSYTFCSLLDIWLWRYFSSVLMDQLDILFLSVLSFPVSHPFSLSHSLCLHLCAIFLQLPRMSTCMYFTGLHGVSDDALWQKLWQVKKKENIFLQTSLHLFVAVVPTQYCHWNEWGYCIFLTQCYCWFEHSVYMCVWVCEGSGECRLAGWLAGSMMAISAAVCFECNLPPGSAGTQCVLGPLLIVWRSTRSPKFTTRRGNDPTWPNPT